MSPVRVGVILTVGLVLSWLHPLPAVVGNYVADPALVAVLIVAVMVPVEIGILLAAATGLIQGGLSGGPFGERAITLTVVAFLAARTARAVQVDSPVVRLLFIGVWSVGALLVDGLVARWLGGSHGLPELGPAAGRVVATTVVGLALWRVTANRQETLRC